MPSQERLCDACQQVKPASKFLPSSLSPTGYLTKCMDCIRKTSEEHRIERARIAEAAERKEHSEVGGRALVSASAIDLAAVRPVGQRLSPELYAVAKRFVFDFRDGNTSPLAALVRAAAAYTLADGKTIDAGLDSSLETLPLRRRRRA